MRSRDWSLVFFTTLSQWSVGIIVCLNVEELSTTVLADVDHANLNLDVDWLSGVIPTTENLAVAIWRRLEGGLPGPFFINVPSNPESMGQLLTIGYLVNTRLLNG